MLLIKHLQCSDLLHLKGTDPSDCILFVTQSLPRHYGERLLMVLSTRRVGKLDCGDIVAYTETEAYRDLEQRSANAATGGKNTCRHCIPRIQ